MGIKEDVWLEQYKHFRQWIADGQKQRDDATQFAVTANAAVAAWILSSENDLSAAIYWLPFVLTLILGIRWWGILRKVRSAGRLMAVLEQQSGLTDKSSHWPGAQMHSDREGREIRATGTWLQKFDRGFRRDFAAWLAMLGIAFFFGLYGKNVSEQSSSVLETPPIVTVVMP